MGTDLENLSCNQGNFSHLEQDRDFFAAQIAPGWGTRGQGGVRVEGATGPRRRAQGGWEKPSMG
jgi:hypothetical protein